MIVGAIVYLCLAFGGRKPAEVAEPQPVGR
jgi:hypothetical protein